MVALLLTLLAADPALLTCDDLDACRAACTAGDSVGCTTLANALVDDDETREEALTLYGGACTKRVWAACSLLAYRLTQFGTESAAEHARALALADKACTNDEPAACSNLASWLWSEGGPSKATEAFKTAAKGCALGDGYGCAIQGRLLMGGIGVTKDVVKAKPLLEQGCEAGSPDGCLGLGLLQLSEPGDRDARRETFELFLNLCLEKRDGAGCHQLSKLIRKGTGVRRDRKRADEVLRDACDLGADAACREVDESP